MAAAAMPPRGAEARPSFGDVARQVLRGSGGGSFRIAGTTLATHFQPVFDVRRGMSVGVEALVRAMDYEGHPVRARGLFESLDRGNRTRVDWLSRALHLRSYAVVDPGNRR